MTSTTAPTTPRASERPAAGFHYGWVIAVLAGLAIFAAFGFGRFVFGLLLPPMKEALALNDFQSGQLAGASLAAYVVAAPLAGVLAARYGPRRVITIALIVLSLSFVGVGWAPDFWAAAGFFALVGFTSGLGIIPALGVISAWFAPRRRGLGMGITLAGPPLCFVVTGFFVPWILAQDPVLGWREAWLVFALVSLAIALLILVALRNRPSDLGLEPIGGPIARPAGVGQGGLRAVLTIRPLWLLSLVYACFGIAYVVYATYLPSFLQQERGFTQAQSGQLWTLIGAAALVGPLIFGWLSDRIGRRYGLALLLVLLAAALLSLIYLPVDFGPWVSALAYGFVMVAVVGVASAACGDYAGPVLAPAAIGFATTFLGLGQAIGPPVAGFLAQELGSFSLPLVLSAWVSVLGALVALFLPRPRRAAAQPAPVPVAAAPLAQGSPRAGAPTATVAGPAVAAPAAPSTVVGVATTKHADAVNSGNAGNSDNLANSAEAVDDSGSEPAPASLDWTTWSGRVIAEETSLAADLAARSSRTSDAELAEVLEIAAARARDRAYRLRRAAPEAAAAATSAAAAAPLATSVRSVEVGSDLALLDHLLARPSTLARNPTPAPGPVERELVDHLRGSLAETTELLREQRDRLRALAGRQRFQRLEGEPVQGSGQGIAYWKVLRPADPAAPLLAWVSQEPGSLLRLPPASAARVLIWQDGDGTCRPLDQPGMTVTAGQVIEIRAGAAAEIAASGDWPATYLVISSPPPVPDGLPDGTAAPLLGDVRPRPEAAPSG